MYYALRMIVIVGAGVGFVFFGPPRVGRCGIPPWHARSCRSRGRDRAIECRISSVSRAATGLRRRGRDAASGTRGRAESDELHAAHPAGTGCRNSWRQSHRRKNGYLMLRASIISLSRAGRWPISISAARIFREFWKWLRAALDVSYGDRRPAFDLAWRASGPEIASAIPDRREVVAAYLGYLLDTRSDGCRCAGRAEARVLQVQPIGRCSIALPTNSYGRTWPTLRAICGVRCSAIMRASLPGASRLRASATGSIGGRRSWREWSSSIWTILHAGASHSTAASRNRASCFARLSCWSRGGVTRCTGNRA